MISPALSRKVARWLLTSDAPTSTRLLIMEATSGEGATDEELLLALEAAGAEGDLLAAGWDESRHPREESGRREGGRFRGGVIMQATEANPVRRAEHIGVGGRVKLTGELADGKVYTITEQTPVGNAGHDIMTLTDEAGNTRKLAGTAGVEHLPTEPDVPIHEEVVPETPPETITVTGRSLKDGDTFFDGNGQKWEVVSSSGGLGRYARVKNLATGDQRVMKASTKVTVNAADHPAAAKRLATASVSHVKGGYEGIFGQSPSAGSKVTVAMNAASEEAAKVMTLPDGLPQIPLKETRSIKYGGAFTSMKNRQTGEITPHSISLRSIETTPDRMISNAHHEVGHYLDATALQGRVARVYTNPSTGVDRLWNGTIARTPEGLGPVMDAIDRSEASTRARSILDSVSGPDANPLKYRIQVNDRSFPVDYEHVKYINDPAEKWARAYEQYHATKSGKRLDEYASEAALPADDLTLDPGESSRSFYGWYWTSEDFAPIEYEIDKMFERMAWSKS